MALGNIMNALPPSVDWDVVCLTCKKCKPWDEMHYCSELGLWEDGHGDEFPILFVDLWIENKSRPIFCMYSGRDWQLLREEMK